MGGVMHHWPKARYLLALSLCLLAFAAAAGAVTTVFTADTVIGIGDTTYDGNDIIVRGCELTVDGSHHFNSLAIQRSPSNVPGVLTQTGGSGVTDLTVTFDVMIQGPDGAMVGSKIDVRGKGYSSEQGPGAGQSAPFFGAGGGYGGRGGSPFEAVGGSAYTAFPALGSGGGRGGSSPGGSGGGAIRLDVSGTLTVSGSILADGGDGQLDGGAGSGGSIWLEVGTLAGDGTVSANGGNASSRNSGGGGGGRIYVDYHNKAFAGSMTAYGGLGAANGGAGLVTKSPYSGGDVAIVDNGGRSGALTPLGNASGCDVTIAGGATVCLDSGCNVTGLHIGPAGRLVPRDPLYLIDFIVSGDATVDAGGSICADGQGYSYGNGNGRGYTDPEGTGYGSGAGHAGYGGDVFSAPGGATYGNCDQVRRVRQRRRRGNGLRHHHSGRFGRRDNQDHRVGHADDQRRGFG